MIMHTNKKYYIDVVEAKPSSLHLLWIVKNVKDWLKDYALKMTENSPFPFRSIQQNRKKSKNSQWCKSSPHSQVQQGGWMGKLRHQFQLRTALLCKKSSNRLVLQQMLDQAITTINMESSSLIQVRLMLVTHQEN